MDTLLKETVNATVNSRYPGMAPEGDGSWKKSWSAREVEKANFTEEGQVSHNIVLVGKGTLRQFYYKNGKTSPKHFSYEGCIVICIESTLKKEPTHLMIEALEDSVVYLLPYDKLMLLTEISWKSICSIARYSNIPLLFHKSKPIPGGSRQHANATAS